MRGILYRTAEGFAALGGFALIAAMLVTVSSVVMNDAFGKPILGDTEIVELLMGMAVASFMPWCQVRGANVIVDFFTMKAPQRVKDALDALAYVVFALVVAVLTWKLIEGAATQYERERVSMFLKLPQWWGYAVASVAAALWVLVCLQTAWQRARLAFAR
ncbi:MAG: TRAP transporter small permease [Betaproteobacteria bacterium]